jgi:hypothetical protein
LFQEKLLPQFYYFEEALGLKVENVENQKKNYSFFLSFFLSVFLFFFLSFFLSSFFLSFFFFTKVALFLWHCLAYNQLNLIFFSFLVLRLNRKSILYDQFYFNDTF